MKRLFILFVTVVLLMFMISACGVAEDPDEEINDGDENAAMTGGTLRIALSSATNTLDFYRTNSGPDFDVLRQIHDTLLLRDPETFDFAPGLATEWEAIDDLTWQLKLREDVVFHNGEPFNAEAVKFSIERYFDPDLSSPHEFALTQIESVEVVDDYTVNITTSEPFPLFLTRNAWAFTGTIVMVPPDYIKENGNEYFAQNPVGTGPYMFNEWIAGERVVLDANPNYWRGEPDFEKIEFIFISEDSTRVSALLSGDVDVIQRVQPDDIGRIDNTENFKVVISESGGLCQMFQVNPEAHPALKEKKVRQALAYAIDMETILETVGGGFAELRPVPADPLAFGYNPNLEPYQYDPEKAKELLREAGYEDGFSLELNTSDGRYFADRAIFEAAVAQIEEVGIEVDLSTMEWGRLVDLMSKRQAGPITMIGWLFSEYDISKLQPALHIDSPYGTFADEEFVNIVREAEREIDSDKRKELWWRAQEILVEEVAFLAAWQPYVIYAAKEYIDWPAAGDMFFVYDVSLE